MTKLDDFKMRPASTTSGMVQQPLVDKDEVIHALEKEIEVLKNENAALKTQIGFARGIPIEELIEKWTEGTRTNYKDPHDVTTKNGTRLEIKYSDVHTLKYTKTKRWNWNHILGSSGEKQFHYLVLAGSKDPLYEYPDLPFVFFLVPRTAAKDIMGRGNCIALNTNLKTARAPKSMALKPYLVLSPSEFVRFKCPTTSTQEI